MSLPPLIGPLPWQAQEVDKFGRQLEAVYQVGKRAAIAQGALQVSRHMILSRHDM